MQALQIENLRPGAGVHFIGIGGVHMRAHAEQMHNSGYTVSGSDRSESVAAAHLASLGIRVHIGHAAENIPLETALVVYTAAVQADNAELVAAHARGIPVMERATLLGQIMKNYAHPICFSGTHGKTTATSMAAEIFLAANANPSVAVGGVLPSIGGTVRDGGRDVFVVESCEYHDQFLQFFPFIGVVLNIEMDHADYFADVNAIYASFRRFAERIPADGALIAHGGIERLAWLTAGLPCRVITVDTDGADWTAGGIRYDENGCAAFTALRGGEAMGEVRLSVPGRHNVGNALSAMAAADLLGVDFAAICEGLRSFRGTNRRAEIKGRLASGAVLMDDYAHHPTEIRATLAAAKAAAYNRVFCLFQPHTRSRTAALLDDFAASFADADEVILLDIYEPAGREEHNYNVTSGDLAVLLAARGACVYYAKNRLDAASYIQKKSVHNDLCITMGAGDITYMDKVLLS